MYFIQGLKKYFDFKSRATRTEFWCFTLSVLVIGVVLSVFDSLLSTESYAEVGMLSGLFQLFILAPTLAVGARRLHDIGKSGWWQLLALTLVGVLVLVVFWMLESNKEANKYGEHVVDKFSIKHLVAQGVLLAVVLLFSTTQSNDLDLVKGTVMDIDKSLTVGEAFDNWQDCASRKWEILETDNGRRVVQFTCDIKNTREFFNELAQYSDAQEDALDVEHHNSIFQWRINKDETVSLSYVGFEMTWLDGKFSEAKSTNAEASVRSVYNNEITYDIDELERMHSDWKKITSAQLAAVYRTVYANAK